MRNWIKAVLLSGAVALTAGCNNDLEVLAPYKQITVVYGLMGNHDTTHWVRINKAYLGEGDAFVYAQIPDSNEYADGVLQDPVVEELDGGTVVNTYPLLDSILNNRVEGTFYSPQHKVYYFNAINLNTDHEYRFRASVKGEQVTASTSMVNNFLINSFDQSPTAKIGLVTSGGNYVDYEINWTSGKDGRRYQVSHVFKYDEVRNGTDTTHKEITWNTGTRVTGSLDGGEPLNAFIDGADFYESIGAIVQPDPTVEKRVFRGVDLVFWVAGDDYHTYLQLADPVSGIVEERPDFTNVNGGYGLFGSRFSKKVVNKQLNPESADELVNGQYTGTLGFCVPNTGFSCN